jgi:hypothetical protein
MKESWEEEFATHLHLDPYADDGDIVGVASGRGTGRPAMELRNQPFSCADLVSQGGRQHVRPRPGERSDGTAESKNPSMSGNFKRENREIPAASVPVGAERSVNASGGTTDVYAAGKSDDPIVPAKRTNNAGTPAAESVEERGSPKGDDWSTGLDRTPSRIIECPSAGHGM